MKVRAKEAIVAALEAEPGLGMRALARRTGFSLGAIRYGLEALERDGVVESREGASRTHEHRLTGRSASPKPAPAWQHETLALLDRKRWSSIAKAAERAVAVPKPTLRWRLHRLVELKLAEQANKGLMLLYRRLH